MIQKDKENLDTAVSKEQVDDVKVRLMIIEWHSLLTFSINIVMVSNF